MTKEELRKNFPTLYIALYHHKTHKNEPMTFKNRPYLKGMYMLADKARRFRGIKSTQCGVSELAVCKSMGGALKGKNIFYYMPTEKIRNRFVKNRFQRSILYTPLYRRASLTGSKSVEIQHIGRGAIAFVGSNSPASFVEFPADWVIGDEYDQCDQNNVFMAEERISNSEDQRELLISNPTFEDEGIDREYQDSTMREWHIRCQCGHWFHPDWWKHVVIEDKSRGFELRDREYDEDGDDDINLICDKCHKPVDRFTAGDWIKQKKHRNEGIRVSKLFSTHTEIRSLLERYKKGLFNLSAEQRFRAGDLGLAYTAKGARITEADLLAIRGTYAMGTDDDRWCAAGIDVGTFFNVVVIGKNLKVREMAAVTEYEEVLDILRRHKVLPAFMDALPETRIAKKFSLSSPHYYRVFYTGDSTWGGPDVIKKIVKVGRTESMDQVREFVLAKRLQLPRDYAKVPGFVEQMTAPVRAYDSALNAEEGGYRWTEGSRPDHYFHAMNYALLAWRTL